MFFFLFSIFPDILLAKEIPPIFEGGGSDSIQLSSSMIDRIVVSILSQLRLSHLVWPRQFDTNNALAALFSKKKNRNRFFVVVVVFFDVF